MAGLAYANRFTREFEFGFELLGGATQSFFPHLVEDAGTVGELNILAQAGAKLSLNPSYSMSIEVHPNVKYLYSQGNLPDFNGLIMNIGFGLHFRFREVPDSSSSIIRSIRFEEVAMPDLFAAMQSYYVKNPAGTIEKLEAGEQVEMDLFASLNHEVFSTEGITPLTGEVIVTYTSKSRPGEQRQPVSYDLTDLFNSLLETVGIETAFLTVPGHIYSAFNTGLPARDYRNQNPERNMGILLDGAIWVSLEITMMGAAYARFGSLAKAEDAFRKALDLESGLISARTNPGNLVFLKGNYREVLKIYNSVLTSLGGRGLDEGNLALKILLNMSEAAYQLADYNGAEEFYGRDSAINPEKADRYSYLVTASKAAADGESCAKTVFVEGTVQDDDSAGAITTGEVKPLSWKVLNSALGDELSWNETTGSFSFEFITTSLSGNITFAVTAEDFNNNATTASVTLIDAGNDIPSSTPVPAQLMWIIYPEYPIPSRGWKTVPAINTSSSPIPKAGMRKTGATMSTVFSWRTAPSCPGCAESPVRYDWTGRRFKAWANTSFSVLPTGIHITPWLPSAQMLISSEAEPPPIRKLLLGGAVGMILAWKTSSKLSTGMRRERK